MDNRVLIGVGGAVGVALLFLAILFAGTPGTAQNAQPVAGAAQPGAGSAAGAPSILVVDRGAILRTSVAGKDLIRQIDEYGKAMEAKYGEEEKKLRADAQELQEQAGVLSPEARQKKERELRERGEALQKKVQEEQAAIQNGINLARTEIEKALGPILKTLFEERGATIMLDRGAIVLGSVDIDVTGEVIKRLDAALPSVTVTPTAPEPGAEQPPAQ
ncbi:MAG: OmpH family outer membrane protein [Micropepsaceae bacterium]